MAVLLGLDILHLATSYLCNLLCQSHAQMRLKTQASSMHLIWCSAANMLVLMKHIKAIRRRLCWVRNAPDEAWHS